MQLIAEADPPLSSAAAGAEFPPALQGRRLRRRGRKRGRRRVWDRRLVIALYHGQRRQEGLRHLLRARLACSGHRSLARFCQRSGARIATAACLDACWCRLALLRRGPEAVWPPCKLQAGYRLKPGAMWRAATPRPCLRAGLGRGAHFKLYTVTACTSCV